MVISLLLVMVEVLRVADEVVRSYIYINNNTMKMRSK